MNLKELENRIENDLVEWNDTLEVMDEYSPEYDMQTGEIQALEYVLRLIRGQLK